MRLVERELIRPCTQPEKLKHLRFLELKARLELRFGVRFLDENGKKEGAHWSFMELREAEKALALIPWRFLRSTPKLEVLRRVRAIGHLDAAERDPDSGEISISDLVCDPKSLRARKGALSEFAQTLLHELGHSVQLGDDKKVRVVSQSVPTIIKLIKDLRESEKTAERNAPIVALLCEARSLRELRKIIEGIGLELLKEDDDSALMRELCAAAALPQLVIPPSSISRYSSESQIRRRFEKVMEALAGFQIELASEPDYLGTAFVKAQLEWAKNLKDYVERAQAGKLSLNELRKADKVIEFLVRMSRRYGVTFRANDAEQWSVVESFASRQFILSLCKSIPPNQVSSFAFPSLIHFGMKADEDQRIQLIGDAKNVNIAPPALELLKSEQSDLLQKLRRAVREREEMLTLQHKYHARVRGAKARVLGPTNPWFDLRGYLRISGWRDLSNNPAVKIHGSEKDMYCSIGGKVTIFDWPLILDGERVMLTFNKLERLLFSYRIESEPEHEPWLYARLDPWEDFACHFSRYLESDELIRFSPLKFDFNEMNFRVYEDDPKVRARLVQAILEKRKANASGEANVRSTIS